jgi:hypothetical protein
MRFRDRGLENELKEDIHRWRFNDGRGRHRDELLEKEFEERKVEGAPDACG